MLKTILILFSFLFYTSFSAQYKVVLAEKSVKFNDGDFNSFSVTIYELPLKGVEKLWKKVMKDMKANVSSKKNEMKGDDAHVKSMGENTFDIYSKALKNDKGVEMSIAFDLGGAFLSSSQHSEKAKEMKKIIYDFAVNATKEGIRGILKEEEKKQSDLEKQQADLIKQKEKLENDIANWKKDIENAKNNIQNNLKNQEEKKKAIDEQKKVVDVVKEKEKSVK
mgnify:CR=1 FL=1|tara:strand:- start:127 stop:792 length:666 start_codon:yes stop_codon:yes gene_type:complete